MRVWLSSARISMSVVVIPVLSHLHMSFVFTPAPSHLCMHFMLTHAPYAFHAHTCTVPPTYAGAAGISAHSKRLHVLRELEAYVSCAPAYCSICGLGAWSVHLLGSLLHGYTCCSDEKCSSVACNVYKLV